MTWQSSWYLEKASPEVVRNTLEGKPDGSFIIRDHPSNEDEFILNYRCVLLSSSAFLHISIPYCARLSLTFGPGFVTTRTRPSSCLSTTVCD